MSKWPSPSGDSLTLSVYDMLRLKIGQNENATFFKMTHTEMQSTASQCMSKRIFCKEY